MDSRSPQSPRSRGVAITAAVTPSSGRGPSSSLTLTVHTSDDQQQHDILMFGGSSPHPGSASAAVAVSTSGEQLQPELAKIHDMYELEVSAREQEHRQFVEERVRLRDRVQKAEAECNILRALLTQEREKALQWNGEKSTLVNALALSAQQINRLTGENERLQALVSSSSSSIHTAVALHQQQQQGALDEAVRRVTALTAHVTTLNAENSALAAEVARLRSQTEGLRGERDSLLADQSTRLRAQEGVVHERDMLRTQMEELRHQMSALQASLQSAQQLQGSGGDRDASEEQQERIRVLERSLAGKEAEVQNLNSNLTAQSVLVQHLKGEKDQLSATLRSLASNEGVWAPAAPAHQSLGSSSDRKPRSGARRASTDTKRHQSSRRRSRSQSAFTDDSSDDGGGTRPQGDLPWVDARGQFVEAEWVSDHLRAYQCFAHNQVRCLQDLLDRKQKQLSELVFVCNSSSSVVPSTSSYSYTPAAGTAEYPSHSPRAHHSQSVSSPSSPTLRRGAQWTVSARSPLTDTPPAMMRSPPSEPDSPHIHSGHSPQDQTQSTLVSTTGSAGASNEAHGQAALMTNTLLQLQLSPIVLRERLEGEVQELLVLVARDADCAQRCARDVSSIQHQATQQVCTVLCERRSLRGLLRAFSAWKGLLYSSVKQQSRLGRVLQRLGNRWKRAALRQWRSHVQHEAVSRLKISSDSARSELEQLLRQANSNAAVASRQIESEAKRKLLAAKLHMMDLVGASAVKRSFAEWQLFVRSRKIARQRLNHSVRTCMKARVRMAVSTWRHFMIQGRQVDAEQKMADHIRARKQAVGQQMARLFSSQSQQSNARLLKEGFLALRHNWLQRQKQRRFLARFAAAATRSSVSRAFNTWKANSHLTAVLSLTQSLEAQRKHESSVMSQAKQLQLVAFFESRKRMWLMKTFMNWRFAYMSHRVKIHSLAQAHRVINMLHGARTVRKLFGRWRVAFVQAEERNRSQTALLRRTMIRLTQHSQWQAFRQWREFAVKSRERDALQQLAARQAVLEQRLTDVRTRAAYSMFRHLNRTSVNPFFTAWKAFTLHQKNQRMITAQADHHSASSAQTEQLLASLAAAKRKLARVLIKRHVHSVVRYFVAWKMHVRQVRHGDQNQLSADAQQQLLQQSAQLEETRQSLLARLAETKTRAARAIIARFRHASVAPVFLAWRTCARQSALLRSEQAQQQEQQAQQTQTQLELQAQNEHLRSLLVANKSRSKEVIIGRWRLASLVPAFQRWRSAVRDSKRVKEEERLRGELMANNQNLASTLAEFKRKAQLTAVAKWTRASLATAFTSWRQHVRAAKRSRAAEEETQARLQQMQQQYESEKQTLIDGSARAREKVALKMISRMTSASMESCFRAWRQCVVHSRQERQEQSRLHQLQLEFEQEKKALLVSADDQQQKVYEKVLKQWNKKTVLARFYQWRLWAQSSKHVRMLQDADSQRHAQVDHVTSTLREQAEALSHTLRRTKSKAKLAIIQKWRNGCVARAFSVWSSYVEDRKEQKRTMIKTLNRIAHGHAWKALRQWRLSVEAAKVDEVRSKFTLENSQLRAMLQQQKSKRAEALLLRWRHHALVPAFRTWRETVKMQVRQKTLMRRVLLRLRNVQLWQGFRIWRERVEQQRAVEVSASDDRTRAAHQHLLGTKQKAIGAFVHSLQRSAEAKVFLTWRMWVQEAKRERLMAAQQETSIKETAALRERMLNMQRRASQAVIQNLQRGALAKTFMAWKMHTRAEKASKLVEQQSQQQYLAVEQQTMRLKTGLQEAKRKASIAIIQNLQRSTNAKVFLAWRSLVRQEKMKKSYDQTAQQEHARMQGLMAETKRRASRAIISKWQHGVLGTSFAAWRMYTRNSKLERQRAQTLHVEAENARRLSVQSQFIASEHKRKVRQMIVTNLMSNAQVAAFSRWRQYVAAVKRERMQDENLKLRESKRRLSVAMIDRMRGHAAATAFRAWRAVVKSDKAARSQATEMERRASVQMDQFKIMVNDEKVTLLSQAAQARERTQSVVSQLQKQRDITVERMVRKWQNVTTASAFRAWRDTARQNKSQRQTVVMRTLKRLTHSLAFRALRVWKQGVEELKTRELRLQLQEQRAKMENVVRDQKKKLSDQMIMKWRARSLVPAFEAWVRHVRDSKAHRQQVLSRTVARLANSSLYQAFALWRRRVEADKVSELAGRLQQLKRKTGEAMVAKWRHQAVVPAFQSWVRFAQERREHKRQVLSRTLARLQHSGTYRALRQWRAVVEQIKVAEVKQTMARENERLHAALADQKKRTTSALIARWRSQAMITTFKGWADHTREARADRKRVLDRTFRRITHSTLYQGFRAWKTFSEHGRVAEFQQLLASKDAAHGAAMSLNAELTVKMAEERRLRVQALLQRWRAQAVVPAFTAWKRFSAERKLQKRTVMTRTLARLEHGELYRALSHWRRVVELQRTAQFQASLAEFDAMKQRMMQENADLKGALKEQKVLSGKMVIDRWRKQEMTTAFERWHDNARAQRDRKRQIIERTVLRLTHSKAYCALRQWRQVVEGQRIRELQHRLDQQNADANAAMRQQLVQQNKLRADMLIARWRHTSLIPAFHAWKRFRAENQKAKQDMMKKTVLRITNTKLWAAWRLWRRFAEDGKVEQLRSAFEQEKAALSNQLRAQRARSGEAMIARWRLATQCHAFEQWRENALEIRKRKRAVMDRTLRRLQNSVIARGFRQWRSNTEAMKLAEMRTAIGVQHQDAITKVRLLAVFSRQNSSAQSRVFRAWKQHTADQRHCKLLLHVGKAWQTSKAKDTLRKMFICWRAQYSAQQHKWRLAMQNGALIAFKHHARSVAQVFRAWRKQAQSSQRRSQLLLRLAAKKRRMMEGTALSRWRQATASHQRSERDDKLNSRAVLACMNTSLHKGMVKSFFRWRLTALISKLARTRQDLQTLTSDHQQSQSQVQALTQSNEHVSKRLSDLESTLQECKRREDVSLQELAQVQARAGALQNTATVERRWREKKALARMAFYRSNMTACRVFRAWAEFSEENRARRLALTRVMMRARSHLLARALNRWRFKGEHCLRVQLQQNLNAQQEENEALVRKLAIFESSPPHVTALLHSGPSADCPSKLADDRLPVYSRPPSSLDGSGLSSPFITRGAAGHQRVLAFDSESELKSMQAAALQSAQLSGIQDNQRTMVEQIAYLQDKIERVGREAAERGAHIRFLTEENEKMHSAMQKRSSSILSGGRGRSRSRTTGSRSGTPKGSKRAPSTSRKSSSSSVRSPSKSPGRSILRSRSSGLSIDTATASYAAHALHSPGQSFGKSPRSLSLDVHLPKPEKDPWPSVSAFFGWPERDSNDAHVISRGGALSRSQQSYYGMRNEAVQVPERG